MKIKDWFKGGPKAGYIPANPITIAAEKMQLARYEALKQAAYLEQEIARCRADLSSAQAKLIIAHDPMMSKFEPSNNESLAAELEALVGKP